MRCIDEPLFMKLLLGELSPEQTAEVDAHLDTCAGCRQLVARGLRAQNPEEPGSERERESSPERGDRATDAPLEKGTAVGRYLILELLGVGGMGVVYSAYDPELDRRVALKLLRVEALGGLERGRAHLLREAQAMARVSHPHVVSVYDVGTFGQQVFLAMERVEAQTLGEWLKASPRPMRQVLALFLDAGRGLAAAHAAGVVHGDFKPENLLVGRDGRVRVTDFGLAHLGAPAGESPLPPLAVRAASAETMTRSVMGGTPAYMAPEQLCDGVRAGPGGDQFAFCVTLHEALYGERPFEGTSLSTLTAEVRAGRVRPPPAGTRVPPWLRRVLLRGLAVRPEERYPSMDALLAELQRDPAARWRRGLSVAGGLTLLAAAVGLTHTVHTRRAQACDATAELAPIWGPERQQAVESAFRATGRPYAGAAWQRVRRELDAYTAAWATTRTTACEATRVRGGQSEEVLAWRMRCLDGRLADVSALSRLLSEADARMVDEAHRAVKALPPLSGCSEALAPGGAPAPEDPAALERRNVLRETLAQGRALKNTGRYKEGVARVEPVAKAAREAGDRREGAEAFLLLGELREGAGDWKGAEAALFEALDAAEATRQDAVAARAWTLLVRVCTVGLDEYEQAARWRNRAAAAIDRLGGGNELLRVNLLTYAGTLLRKQAHYAEALAQQQQALALVEHAFGPDSLEAADVYQELGATRLDQGEWVEARSHVERAVELTRQALGPEHPEVARVRLALAPVLRDQGEFTQAEAVSRDALAVFERTLGPDHPRVYDALNDVASSLLVQQRLDEALPVYERALEVARKSDGPESMGAAIIHSNLGLMFFRQKKWDEAQAHFNMSVAIREKRLGAHEEGLVMPLRFISRALNQQQRFEESVRYVQRAADIVLMQQDDTRRLWTATLNDLGATYLKAGRPAEALAPLERALAGWERARSMPGQRTDTLFLLARALWDSGQDRERAVRLAREAKAAAMKDGPSSAGMLERIGTWLAERGVR
ncbi:tetratricopeptide repeat protein [Myxococcus sp. RHSTA-1-4]|uniref:tetratricopeptide repeat protein n=1 Tax=Myxococcus sp. RHSTA-1-4 TaxID=2874601 RepID=UPI001CBEC63D|nr:tetratricopeptide repeat protein [Myxococcus sp. RHSTA-1-4]MBZ4420099.1 tetratricopeptide repeat protein [Myxococcus sp. RHSTA-1-4]